MTTKNIQHFILILILIILPANCIYSQDSYFPVPQYDLSQDKLDNNSAPYKNVIDSLQAARDYLRNNYNKSNLPKSDSVLEFVGSGMWGGTLDTEISGDVVFALNMHGLQIFDINDMTTPVKNIPIENGQYFDHAFLDGNILYLGRGNRLYIFDVSAPYDPVQLSVTDIPANFMEIIVQNNRVYLGRILSSYSDSDYEPSLYIYDISDLSNLAYVSGYTHPVSNATGCRRFTIADDIIYAISSLFKSMDVISIADETDPQNLTRITFPDTPWDVAILGRYLIAISDAGMCIYDIIIPDDPVLVEIYPLLGNWACETVNDKLFVRHTYQIKVFAITSKGILEEIANFDSRDAWYSVTVVGNRLLAPSYVLGFDIFDISNLSNVTTIASYVTDFFHFIGIDVDEDYVYTCRASYGSVSAIQVCDATDKQNPLYINSVPGPGNCFDIKISDTELYLANFTVVWGLVAYDLPEPTLPVEICRSDSISKNIYMYDSLLFVSGQYKGLYIYNTAQSGCPQIISHIPQEINGHIVEASCADDNYVYMMEKNYDSLSSAGVPYHFRVSDYSNPSQPFTTALLYLTKAPPSYMEMVKRGNIVYVAAGTYGLLAIDVSDPYNPIIIGHYEPFSDKAYASWVYCRNLTIKGFYIFLSVSSASVIQVINMANPSSPTLVDYYNLPSYVYHLEVQGDYLYSVCNDAMYIHHINLPPIACGDANADGSLNIFDVTFLISYLYKGGPSPDPLNVADVNNDSAVNIFDITYYITYLYKDGPAPSCP